LSNKYGAGIKGTFDKETKVDETQL